jgi:mono/diheme cytochrome c family protein
LTYLRKTLTLILAVVVLSGLTTSIVFAQDPDNGKLIWEEQTGCQRCHGPAAEGLWAGPLAGSTKTAQEFIDQVRSPRRNMPHFSAEQVSDQMIIDIHAYVSSLPPITDFTPADAGLPADAPQGQVLLVEKRCVACHGDTGPIMRFMDRGETPTAEAVIKQLRTPFKNMPAFFPEQVSDAEAGLIADFMAQEIAAQSAPAALPQSGSSLPAARPVGMLLIGGGLVLTGFIFRRLAKA